MDLNELDEGPLSDFQGATLQIHGDSFPITPTSDSDSLSRVSLSNNSSHLATNNLNRHTREEIVLSPAVLSGLDAVSPIQNKRHGSQVRDVVSTTPMLPGDEARDYFSYRDGLVEKAIAECVRDLIKTEQDGDVLGTWLLTEISFWDNEKERLVILTSRTITSVKYDFIALKQLEYRKVPISLVDTIVIGDLVYPSGSLVPSRNVRGVRAMWNRGEPLAFTKKWNPFNNEIPFTTFASHPLLYHRESGTEGNVIYDLEQFATQLVSAIERAQAPGHLGPAEVKCLVKHSPIVLQNYVGLGSLIHNRNALGFFKVRGKFSF